MKKISLLFLTFLIIQNISAQFLPPVNISNNTDEIESPLNLLTGDLDNDGDIDFILHDDIYKSVFWYENLDGAGTMDEPKSIPELSYPSYIWLEDVDNDGVLDIIGVNEQNFYWVKNTIPTTGLFSEPNYLPDGDDLQLKDIELEDVNGDGINDLISVGYDSSISWYKGIGGNGNFLSSSELIADGKLLIELTDIDNDGDLDIVSTSDANTSLGIVWFENLGGEDNFGLPQDIEAVIPFPDDLQVADLDNDGDMDVLLGLGDGTDNHLLYNWYENKLNENGTWIKKIITAQERMAPPAIYDIDFDGDLDLVTSQGGLRIYENINGLGNFVPGIPLTIFDSFNLSSGDINNDNIPDIVGVHKNAIFFEMGLLYFGRNDQTFENPIDFIGDADLFPLDGGFIEGRDLTGDGISEVVISHRIMDRFSWQSFNSSDQKFTNPKIIDDVRATDISFADIDLDGDEDMVVLAIEPEFEAIWYEKINGEENYELGKILFSDDQGSGNIFTNDLDNDGDQDILINRKGIFDEGIYWLENLNGQGSFSSLQIINSSSFEQLQLEDIDLDGDADLIYYDKLGNNFSWLKNDNGVFSNPESLIVVDDQESYLLTDLDGNGWKDLVFFSEENKVTIHKNNGAIGDYSEAIDFFLEYDFDLKSQFFLRDFDFDGDLDLLISEIVFEASFLHVHENIGGSNIFLSTSISFELPSSTTQISIDDYDGDQDLDLIAHTDDFKELQYFENVFSQTNIIGKVFLDFNENTILDEGEFLIFPNSIDLEPGANFEYPSGIGYFNYVVESGNYDITCSVPSSFLFTTPSSVSVTINEDENTEICFGVIPERAEAAVENTITSAPTRCGFEVPFWLDYQNTGTVISKAIISMMIDPRATFISASQLPDSIVEDRIYWSHDNLLPTHSGQIKVLLEMPGVEAIGEFLSFNHIINIQSLDGTYFADSGVGYRPQINCAYDPNDKLVEPNIPGYDNFTLFGDTLDYVVRFQNTGTDTAFTVVIEDFLDANLDYSTLNIQGASHPYKATLDQETGRLVFIFENILLPDSTTNEIASHGFFRYQILANSNLDENTSIQNFASIFFDLNPPILTNTVENILVSDIPILVNAQSPACFNDSTGSLMVVEISPFIDSIVWNNGVIGPFIDGLVGGSYEVSFFYIDGAILDTSFFLFEPNPIAVSDLVVDSISCFGVNDGSIEFIVNGGTQPYLYQWNNSSNTAIQNNLFPDVYELTITDQNGCQDSLEVTLESPSEIIFSIEVTPEMDQVANGSIIVEPTGGQPPYNFNWSHDATQSSNIVMNLSAGEYTVTVTDADNCIRIETILVDQIVNTNNLNEYTKFFISPNPNNGLFTVDLSFQNSVNWEVKITNSLGQITRKEIAPGRSSDNSKLDFQLSNGIYWVTLLVDGKVVGSETVVVE